MADANAPVTVQIGSGETVSLTPGQDYQLRHKIPGLQRKDRYSRLGFVGQEHGELLFSARGPDRATSGRYGGTQHFNAEWILAVKPVAADHAARYMNESAPLVPRPQRGVPLLPPGQPRRRQPHAERLPQHLADDGSWCPGSGQTAAKGRCPVLLCSARLPLDGTPRTDPAKVLEAAIGYGVRAMLKSGPDLLPPCGVPLDPEPERLVITRVEAGGGPFTTVITAVYPGGAERHVWVTVELPEGEVSR